MCCVNDCNVETHANIFVWNISLLVEARANIPTLFMINLKFTKSILVPIILYFPWFLYTNNCNVHTHADFISECVVGTVCVVSVYSVHVYTCTAHWLVQLYSPAMLCEAWWRHQTSWELRVFVVGMTSLTFDQLEKDIKLTTNAPTHARTHNTVHWAPADLKTRLKSSSAKLSRVKLPWDDPWNCNCKRF